MSRFEGNIITALAIAALGLTFSAHAQADTITFQNGENGYQGTEDSHFYSSTLANRNYGVAPSLQAGVTSNGASERRTIIRFDVASFAGQYDSIQSAQLNLTGTGGGSNISTESSTLNLYQIVDANAAWIEGDNTFTTADTGEPAWNWRARPTGWTGSSGLKTAGTDYVDTVLDTIAYDPDDGDGTIYSADIDPTLINEWATGTNAGLLLTLPDLSEDRLSQFHSSEASTQANRPELVVNFTPIPEPGSAAVLGAAGAGLLCLRRRKRQ